jgi:hypothetical protein
MTRDEATALRDYLNERLTGVIGPDGNPLEFLATHPDNSTRKTDWSIRDKRMVRKVNLMSQKPFMEEEGTPYYLSPSSETYWSR